MEYRGACHFSFVFSSVHTSLKAYSHWRRMRRRKRKDIHPSYASDACKATQVKTVRMRVNSVIKYDLHTYIHTSFFRCSPRGFSATCLQQMQGSVVEGLSQTATSGSQCFFVWDIKLCPQLTVHNTGISLLLSTSVWVLLSPPIERRETRPTA